MKRSYKCDSNSTTFISTMIRRVTHQEGILDGAEKTFKKKKKGGYWTSLYVSLIHWSPPWMSVVQSLSTFSGIHTLIIILHYSSGREETQGAQRKNKKNTRHQNPTPASKTYSSRNLKPLYRSRSNHTTTN